jgi:2-succinyl-6-hydroxy-2,4-cyclohexadiene-1-carboxylate synthase
MQEKRIKINQIELQVRDYENNKEGIIFLHFSGANLFMWQPAIPFFLDIYRLILLDLRGHGKSDKPETGYDMDVMARDVSGVMEQLKLNQAHIIGSSMGAEVGLSLAANYPEKVLSLVCDGALSSEYGPYGTWAGSKDEFHQHVAGSLDQMHNSPEKVYASVDALVEKSRESLEEIGWWNELVEAMERYGANVLEDGKVPRGFRKFAREDYYKHYFQYRLEDYYKKVQCPILMVPGEDVYENKREIAAMEGLRKLAAQAQILRVDGWEHPYGWLINPQPMCQAILKFLIRIEPKKG